MLCAPALQFQAGLAATRVAPPSGIIARVRKVLDLPDEELDYAAAKITFDSLIDPNFDRGWVLAALHRLTKTARDLAGPSPSEAAKLNALRKLIYQGGPWNGWRPFEYDHSNLRGTKVQLKLLSNYLRTRRGDCVSMPVLFLILAERLGLDVGLSLAPNHFFVKLKAADGRIINLEPTSGGNPARDQWIRHIRPMSDRSIASGMYLRRLGRREGIASMAMSVVQFLRDQGRLEETADLCELILAHSPRDGLVLVNLSGACGRMFDQARGQYLDEYAMPLDDRLRAWVLLTRNRAAAARARALGWEDGERLSEPL